MKPEDYKPEVFHDGIERQNVESSNIESVGHDPDTNILQVEFKSGVIWQYNEVPESVFADMMRVAESGESVGRFFRKNVKPVFKSASCVFDPNRSER